MKIIKLKHNFKKMFVIKIKYQKYIIMKTKNIKSYIYNNFLIFYILTEECQKMN